MEALLHKVGVSHVLDPGVYLIGNDCAAAGVYRHFLGLPYPCPFAYAYMPPLAFLHLVQTFNRVDWNNVDYTPRTITAREAYLTYGVPGDFDACMEIRLHLGCVDTGYLFTHVSAGDDEFAGKIARRVERFMKALHGKRPVFCMDLHDWEVANGTPLEYCRRFIENRDDAVFVYRPVRPKTDLEHSRNMLDALVEKGIVRKAD